MSHDSAIHEPANPLVPNDTMRSAPPRRGFFATLLGLPGSITLSSEETAAFETYRNTLMLNLWPRIGLLIASAALLWWPLDWLVYSGRPWIIADLIRLRTSIICVNVAAFLFSKTNVAKRVTIPVIGLVIIVESFVVGFSCRHFGGVEGPWIHYFNAFPVITVLFFVRVAGRVAVNVAMCASFLIGVLTGDWRGILHPDFPSTVTFQLFVVALSSFLGHMAYELFRGDFVFRRRLDTKHNEVRELAEQLESRVAAQTEELRRLAHRNEQIREEERRAIAREIHDQLGQMMTAIRYGLFYAKSKIQDDPENAQQSIGEVLTLTTRTSETVRRLHTMLHPQVLEEFGLFGAVEWLIHESTKHTKLEIEFETLGTDEFLDFEKSLAVFRSAQEGVTNILKHANARRGQLSIQVTDERLHFALHDDGNAPIPAKTSKGLGLIGIRERAQALQGKATWSRCSDGGFLLSLEIPLLQGDNS